MWWCLIFFYDDLDDEALSSDRRRMRPAQDNFIYLSIYMVERGNVAAMCTWWSSRRQRPIPMRVM